MQSHVMEELKNCWTGAKRRGQREGWRNWKEEDGQNETAWMGEDGKAESMWRRLLSSVRHLRSTALSSPLPLLPVSFKRPRIWF